MEFFVEENHKLALVIGKDLDDPTRYQRLVRRLIYRTIISPELSYAIHILSQLMQNPKVAHTDAVHRVLCYIKVMPGYGVLLRSGSSFDVNVFCDAACPLTRRSLTGYLVTLGGSLISWKTKKQATISRSSAEVEHKSMASATNEMICGIVGYVSHHADAPLSLIHI